MREAGKQGGRNLTHSAIQGRFYSTGAKIKLFARLALLSICVTQLSVWASPRDIQPVNSIRTAAAVFLEASVQHSRDATNRVNSNSTVEVGQLDPRLALDRCGIPLTAFLPSGAHLYGKTTVGVRCDGNKPWTVYVPAHIRTAERFIVTKRFLQRGQTLNTEDIEYTEQDISTMPGNYLTRTEDAIGMELKQRLSPGSTLTANMLKKPNMVKKGQQVTIYSNNKGLHVSSAGIAQANGAEGDRIKVKNPYSKRIVEGIVQANGSVETGR